MNEFLDWILRLQFVEVFGLILILILLKDKNEN